MDICFCVCFTFIAELFYNDWKTFFCGIAEITKFFPTFMEFEQKLLQDMKLKK